MTETVQHFNSLYTIITLIFACGVSYATIKVSLKGMSDQVKKLDERVIELERSLRALEIEKEVSAYRFEEMSKQLKDIRRVLDKISDFQHTLEKRGIQQWQQVTPTTST